MDISFHAGTWTIPAAATAIAFSWAWMNADHKPATGYGSLGKGVVNAFVCGIATIASLVAWLIWALAT